MFLVFSLYALIASTFIASKLLLSYFSPSALLLIRMLLPGFFLLLYCVLFKIQTLRQVQQIFYNLKLFFLLIITSLFHIFIPFLSEFTALVKLDAAISCLLYDLSPFFTALFSYFIFREKLTTYKFIGFFISFCAILVYFKSAFYSFYFLENAQYKAILLMFCAVISASLGWVLVQYLIKEGKLSPLFINGFAMFLSGFIVLPVSLKNDFILQPINYTNIKSIIGCCAFLIISTNFIFYNLYSFLLKRYSATFLALVGFITPLFAALLDALFLGIKLKSNFYFTVFFVGIGIAIFYKDELKQASFLIK